MQHVKAFYLFVSLRGVAKTARATHISNILSY